MDLLITGQKYSDIIELLFPRATKKQICEELKITRPTHDLRLVSGIRYKKDLDIIERLVQGEVCSLRRRARVLDEWLFNVLKSDTPQELASGLSHSEMQAILSDIYHNGFEHHMTSYRQYLDCKEASEYTFINEKD